MTATVEHIKQEIRSLNADEVNTLLRDLQNEYVMPSPDHEDEASAKAAWDAEIAERVRDVTEGRVKLISAEESDLRTEALFARLGIKRPVYRP